MISVPGRIGGFFIKAIGWGAFMIEPVRQELVFEAGHFTCSPFFRTSPNNYGFCLLCLLSAQKNHIFERELAQLDFFLRFLDVFSAESGRLG